MGRSPESARARDAARARRHRDPGNHTLGCTHRDLSIHIERACQLHGVKMTRHGLLHKRLTSAYPKLGRF